MRNLKWLAASLLAVAGSAAGGEGLREPDARQQTLTLHLRTYYLDREKPTPPDFKSHAAGGWIGYDSGWFFDRFKLVLTGYTSQKLEGPLDQDGALLLKPGQRSYSVLGEAYASDKLWNEHKFTGGQIGRAHV